LSASAVIFADEIVKRIAVGMLVRYPMRRAKSGGVFVIRRTTTPYSKEVRDMPAKVIAIVSRTRGALVSIVPYDESAGSSRAALLPRVWANEKV
jgi:hypothetical protein